MTPDDMRRFGKIEKLIEKEVPKLEVPKALGDGPVYDPKSAGTRGGRGGRGGGRGPGGRHTGGRRHGGGKSGGSSSGGGQGGKRHFKRRGKPGGGQSKGA